MRPANEDASAQSNGTSLFEGRSAAAADIGPWDADACNELRGTTYPAAKLAATATAAKHEKPRMTIFNFKLNV